MKYALNIQLAVWASALMLAACGNDNSSDDQDSAGILLETPAEPSNGATTPTATASSDGDSTDVTPSNTEMNTQARPTETSVDQSNDSQAMPSDSPSSANTDIPAARESLDLDLDNDQDNLLAFWKTRGSLNPDEDVVYYWTGHIYLAQDADPNGTPINDFPGPIMQFEGFNIARFEEVPGGVRMVSREMSLYKDLTGRILNCWNNRRLGVETPGFVPVVHVFNDPVNHTIGGGSVNVFGDNVTWNVEIMLRYPSPLPVSQYAEYSAGNTYESSEMFNFYTRMQDLNDPSLDSVPVNISWSRVGQFLPWMKAGQTPGKLIYHTSGQKLLGGFEELPEHIKEYVRNNAPKYMTAPDRDISPNETSWKVFRKLLEAGEYNPECQ